jgi:hypothetical protein
VGPFACVIAFIALAVGLIIIAAHQAKKRREAFAAFAAQLGMGFQPDPGDELHQQFEAMGLSPFGQGHSRRASNLLFGRRGGVDWEAFDYRYTTGSGKNKSTHHYGIVAAKVLLAFPPTRVRPEGAFDKLKALFGFEDINFESDAFSRRYHVNSADRRRAYDLIHPQMIEYLMNIEPRDWQLAGPVVMLTALGSHEPNEILREMQLIEQFLARVPDYLRQDLSRPAMGVPPAAPGM